MLKCRMAYMQSPCIRNCCLNTDDVCLGCFRTINEIKKWANTITSIQEKKQILINAKKREKSINLHHKTIK